MKGLDGLNGESRIEDSEWRTRKDKGLPGDDDGRKKEQLKARTIRMAAIRPTKTSELLKKTSASRLRNRVDWPIAIWEGELLDG